MSKTPQWYGGRSEEYFEFGPAASKEQILDEAKDEGLTHVHVGIFEKREIPLAGYFDVDQWFEDLEDQMDDDDGPDENGQRHPLDVLETDDVKILGLMIRDTIQKWQSGLDYKVLRYWLDSVGPLDYTATGLVEGEPLL